MTYAVRVSESADSYLQRLNGRAQRRIVTRLAQIAENPLDPRHSKRLVNASGVRSCRVGGWRILFYVDEDTQQVDVTEIAPRGEAYRRL